MHNITLLIFAFLSSTIGFALLALSLNRHWRDVTGSAHTSAKLVKPFRYIGYTAIVLSWWIAYFRDGVSFGTVLWISLLALSTIIVAFLLTWFPGWLKIFIR